MDLFSRPSRASHSSPKKKEQKKPLRCCFSIFHLHSFTNAQQEDRPFPPCRIHTHRLFPQSRASDFHNNRLFPDFHPPGEGGSTLAFFAFLLNCALPFARNAAGGGRERHSFSFFMMSKETKSSLTEFGVMCLIHLRSLTGLSLRGYFKTKSNRDSRAYTIVRLAGEYPLLLFFFSHFGSDGGRRRCVVAISWSSCCCR